MQTEYPQSNIYYSSILIAFMIWILLLLFDIFWYQPDENLFTYIWDLWATGIIIQWIVYIFRMLHIRKQFRQSKKDGIPIIMDKKRKINVLYQYLFCVPWWATKIDNTAIELIGEAHRIEQKKNDDAPVQWRDEKQFVII